MFSTQRCGVLKHPKEEHMELTDRKKKVLRSVVDLYIRTAEPVGSKAITALPDMNYSSATIRNEMADLTAMGYLEQPHTSAGRIPSTAGYRQEIHQMNKEHRGIDRPTDVLSFPMVEYEEAGQFDFLEDQYDCFHPETGELLLGDIVISKDRVIAQAEEYGHEIKREYAFLIAHSMLHLFGYDHMEEEERKTMERMQNEILNALNIVR